ncbi:MAG TPA: hypothetical protein VNO31_19660 [Umezawaea sp.]|nr:hypothetical protein [Umezawaea sp.]
MPFACAATDPRHAAPGFTVAVVEQSDNPAFAVGDHVAGTTGWQDYAVCDGPNPRVIDPDAAPLAANLGVLGITGLTEWVGLTRILDPKPGGTLVVTAPAVAGRQPHYGTHAIEGWRPSPPRSRGCSRAAGKMIAKIG